MSSILTVLVAMVALLAAPTEPAKPQQHLASPSGPSTQAVQQTAESDGAPTDGFTNYVALGDSYTAGPLIPVQLPGPLGCFRSSADYPAFLAGYLGVQSFTDVSCSAARTKHLFEPQTGSLPAGLPSNTNAPQIQAVTPNTDLVTLGIGGNDFSLFGELIDQCAELAANDPNGAPCRDHFTVNGVDTKLRDARRIQDHLESALRAITNRAPNATVVVVGYLHILPEAGTCAAVPFAAGDYLWGTSVHKALNKSLRQAARLFGAVYVDMYAASRGHDACAGSEAWVNGATIKPWALNYHPLRSGMRNIAKTIYTALTGRPPAATLPELQLLRLQNLPNNVEL